MMETKLHQTSVPPFGTLQGHFPDCHRATRGSEDTSSPPQLLQLPQLVVKHRFDDECDPFLSKSRKDSKQIARQIRAIQQQIVE